MFAKSQITHKTVQEFCLICQKVIIFITKRPWKNQRLVLYTIRNKIVVLFTHGIPHSHSKRVSNESLV